jgi:hypothetical protein
MISCGQTSWGLEDELSFSGSFVMVGFDVNPLCLFNLSSTTRDLFLNFRAAGGLF